MKIIIIETYYQI